MKSQEEKDLTRNEDSQRIECDELLNSELSEVEGGLGCNSCTIGCYSSSLL